MKKTAALSIAMLLISSAWVQAESDHSHQNSGHTAQMQDEIIQIQKEPNLEKRQAAMKAHMEKMQASMGSKFKEGKSGKDISSKMMQQRQAMRDEMIKITNEPNTEKRMAMLSIHIKKMQEMQESNPAANDMH
ncbi:hypothetical protein MNBD_GAMMA25-1601 [hydrothermal vent metagenome]|uniref:Uncharacterized protein n=1 Tax=hydrothermal vent metagenome TaxID=652676 RepID=A0A3B1AZ73_9ZZZZ